MQIIITPNGAVRCIYSEHIDLAALGSPTITRASRVEPDQQGRWSADMGPVNGPRLGPYNLRSEALVAEHAWLEAHWLGSDKSTPCDHNEMVANNDPTYPWKCAKCGHVYGKAD